VSQRVFVCLLPNFSETTVSYELKLWGMIYFWAADRFWLKITSRYLVNRSPENRLKTLVTVATPGNFLFLPLYSLVGEIESANRKESGSKPD